MSQAGAIMSCFPVEERPSEADYATILERSRKSLKPVPSITGKISDEQIEQTILYLAQHPAQIPPEMRIYLLQDLMRQDYNAGQTMLAEDIARFRMEHPAEAWVVRSYINAWLTDNQLYAIKWDEKVTATICAGRVDQGKSLFRRCLENWLMTPGEKQTALIHEALNLAAKNEALRLENHRVAAETETIKKGNEEISKRIEKVLAEATKDSERIVSEARRKAEQLERQAQRKIEKLNLEIARLEQAKRAILTKQPELQTALTNPKQEVDEFKEKVKSITKRLASIGAQYQTFSECADGLEVALGTLGFVFDMVREFSEDELVRLLSIDVEVPDDSVICAGYGGRVKIVSERMLQLFITALANPKISKEDLLTPFTDLVNFIRKNEDRKDDWNVSEDKLTRGRDMLFQKLRGFALDAAKT